MPVAKKKEKERKRKREYHVRERDTLSSRARCYNLGKAFDYYLLPLT